MHVSSTYGDDNKKTDHNNSQARRRIYACHMRRMRRRVHVCHMRRRRRRIHASDNNKRRIITRIV
jgi:hypothetical protein